MTTTSRAGRRSGNAHLRLLGGFHLSTQEGTLSVPLSAQRTLAFLALQSGPQRRIHVAGTLWPDVTEKAAMASLRSSIWRLRRLGGEFVSSSDGLIGLAASLQVDVRDVESRAIRLMEGATRVEPGDLEAVSLSGDILPGWYDDWVFPEQERLRQLCLHALDSLCQRFAAAGQFGLAVEAGMAAVRMEPLRESAHKALIATHLDEGNRPEAVRQYRWYRRLLWDELGLRPSPDIRRLVEALSVRWAEPAPT
jgi:DNA-binding SARP family transcriptional activator